MIYNILDQLDKNGLIHCVNNARFTLRLTRTMTNVHLFSNTGDNLYLKIAPHSPDSTPFLVNEFNALKGQADDLSRYCPRALKFLKFERFDVLITEGITHRTLSNYDIEARNPVVADAISTFLSLYSNVHRSKHSSLCKEVLATEQFIERYLGVEAIKVWVPAGAVDCTRDLAAVNQHGDFTVNNLGWGPKGLLVLDWEDFSVTALPGFDVATLILSLSNFEGNHVMQYLDALKTQSANCHRLRRWCNASGIDASIFVTLFPLYLATLMKMRTRYDSDVGRKIIRVMDYLQQYPTR